eukprot:4557540-Prymnesium_polylepis.1
MTSGESSRLLGQALELVGGRPEALTDVRVVASLLRAHGRQRRAAEAEALYVHACARGLRPTGALLVARCAAHAMGGELPAAIEAFDDARRLLLSEREGGGEGGGVGGGVGGVDG